MLLNLISGSYSADLEESWETERTVNASMDVPIHFHETSCSLNEITTILSEFGVEGSHGAIWNGVYRLADSGCDPPTAKSSRSQLTKPLSKLMANGFGCMLQ